MRGAGDLIKAPPAREPASEARNYTCSATDDGLFNIDPIRVAMSGSKLTVSYKDESGSLRKESGAQDEGYRPRGKSTSQIKFSGKYEALIDESGVVVVIANKNILSESTKKTWVKLQWTGEAFESGFYSCTLIP